tara:strand:+ start:120 stop:1904 length:1785 start_codon:yes stop_codon:yes gene_type:complete
MIKKIQNSLNSSFSPYLSLLKIIKIASANKPNKLIFLSFLLVINGFAELISLASFLPFLSILSNPNEIPEFLYFNFLINFLKISSDQLIFSTTIIFVILIIVSLVIRLYTLRYGLNLTKELGTNLSSTAFKNTIHQPYSIQTTRNSGEIINSLTTEIENAIKSLNIFVKFATSFVTFCFILVGLLLINTFVALISIALIGFLYFLIAKKSSKKLKKYSYIYTEKNNRIVRHIQETLGSKRDIILDNNHKYYSSIFRELQKKRRSTVAEIDFISTYPAYVLEALAFLIFAFLGIFLSLKVSQTINILSVLGTVALGFQKLLRSTQQIYRGFSQIKAKSASFDNVLKMCEKKLEPIYFIKESNNLDFKSNIKLKNIFFRYGNDLPWTLKNIDLTLFKGETIGLIGPTGTGKSTLIDIIMGLLDPTEGEVLIDGENIKENINLRQKWFNSISHVPQDIYLCDGSFSDNIALGISKKEMNIDRVHEAAEIANIKKYIETCSNSFNTFVGERGITLSGGQRQRIAIARAIYKQAKVLIFDEATSALDNDTELKVIKSINSIKKDVTIIMIAHRLSSLSFCNKIVELDRGKIISVKNSLN